MKSKEFLERHLKSKSFARYMLTNGVREYRHFGKIAPDFKPTIADAAMALYESIGKAKCAEIGVFCEASGMVMADGVPIGRSKLAEGKAAKDLSISLWLEDVGQLGFVTAHLREEMDAALWSGWFDANVTGLITPELVKANHERSKAEYSQRRVQFHPWYVTLWIKLREFPSRWRVRRHYARQGHNVIYTARASSTKED